MKKITKNQFILVVVVVLLAVGVAAYLVNRVQSVPKSNTAENPQTQTPTGENAQTQTTATGTAAVSSTKPLSYGAVLKMYADRRIQFDANCIVTPYNGTFRNGIKVMLDNRYNKGRSVYLNDVQYYLGPYGYKIITLSTTASTPYTIMVDCGAGKNNGTITLH